MFRLAIEYAPVLLVSEEVFDSIEEAVKAQIKNDGRNCFTVIQKKEDGQWTKVNAHETLGLKIRLQA